MLKCRLKEWVLIGIAAVQVVILCHSSAWADEAQRTIAGYPSFKQPSSTVRGLGFLLNFSQRYYDEVDASLQQNSYFVFRYYLASPFESFDKRQFIYENPTQANDLAMRALHNAIQGAVDDIELLENLRDHVNAMTSLKMVIGKNGARFHGPSITELELQDSASRDESKSKMTITSGLTFAEDFRLGLTFTIAYLRIISKLRYYPTSANEIAYTAETPLSSFSKVGLSYHRSNDANALLTTFSIAF